MYQASRAFPLWAPPHKAGCPSSAPPPPALTLHLQNTKHGNTCRNIAALTAASTLSVPRNRLPGLCKGSWKADGNLDGQFSNLVMTKLTKLEVGNPPSRGQQLHLHLHLPPRNGQDRDRPLSDPPRIGLTARCRQQGGLEEWPNTAGTAPTNSLAPHDQRPNSDQKHGQCQTDFINRSPPPHLQPLGLHLISNLWDAVFGLVLLIDTGRPLITAITVPRPSEAARRRHQSPTRGWAEFQRRCLQHRRKEHYPYLFWPHFVQTVFAMRPSVPRVPDVGLKIARSGTAVCHKRRGHRPSHLAERLLTTSVQCPNIPADPRKPDHHGRYTRQPLQYQISGRTFLHHHPPHTSTVESKKLHLIISPWSWFLASYDRG